MNIPVMAEWAAKKGIDLIGAGDWTHPIWLRELQANLTEAGDGIYQYQGLKTKFLLSTELSCIYSQGGKSRRIHLIILAPGFAAVEKINRELTLRGANLLSDGRPILGLSSQSLTDLILSADEKCLVIPAHAWTPWFSLYGSMSGFDSIEECFGEFSKNIYAVESGLSSDPAMNWRIEELVNRAIVSFSDAHSPAKLGREATVFQAQSSMQKAESLTYKNIYDAIAGNSGDWGIAHTIEFYPEEGKYHYTGHRNCQVVYSPNETRKLGTTCPVCGKPLTVGVMSRVEHLAKMEIETETEKDKFGVRWIKNRQVVRPPYAMLVPLMEILAESLESTPASQKVSNLYEQLNGSLGGEFKILLETEIEDIKRIAGEKAAEGVAKVRGGDIAIEPGYDGVFGKVKIWPTSPEALEERPLNQGTLF